MVFCLRQSLFPLLTIRTWVNHEVMTNVIVNTSHSNIRKSVTWTNHHISWTLFRHMTHMIYKLYDIIWGNLRLESSR